MTETPKDETRPNAGTDLVTLVDLVTSKMDPLLKMVTTFYERRLTQRESEIKFTKFMALCAAALVIFIVLVCAFLTFYGKLDGSTFGFLIGVVIGSALTFVRDMVKPDGKSR